VLGHLNISVKRFPSSGEMAQALEKGEIDIAIVSQNMSEKMKSDDPKNPVSILVDLGSAPVLGISGKEILRWGDLNGKTVYVPSATAVGERVREHFGFFGIQPKIEPIKSSEARTLNNAQIAMSVFIGSPLWVKDCFAGETTLNSRLEKRTLFEIQSSFVPKTPATLAFNKACSRAPLRRFLMSLSEVIVDVSKFVDPAEWDLGDAQADSDLKAIIDSIFGERSSTRSTNGSMNVGFTRDAYFFSVVALWNAEVQTLSRALARNT
jgi:hypothetical protein